MLTWGCLARSRWTGQSSFVVGMPVPLRPRPELEGVIGPFENILPLRLDFADMVRSVCLHACRSVSLF
jgi:non-ribosomal peptide synthetase component F